MTRQTTIKPAPSAVKKGSVHIESLTQGAARHADFTDTGTLIMGGIGISPEVVIRLAGVRFLLKYAIEEAELEKITLLPTLFRLWPEP